MWEPAHRAGRNTRPDTSQRGYRQNPQLTHSPTIHHVTIEASSHSPWQPDSVPEVCPAVQVTVPEAVPLYPEGHE